MLPGVVLLGAGAPRCGALGCWCSQVLCSWVLVLTGVVLLGDKANQCHPAILYFDNGTSPVWVWGTLEGMSDEGGGKRRNDDGGGKVRCDEGGGKGRSDDGGGKVRCD